MGTGPPAVRAKNWRPSASSLPQQASHAAPSATSWLSSARAHSPPTWCQPSAGSRGCPSSSAAPGTSSSQTLPGSKAGGGKTGHGWRWSAIKKKGG